MSLISYRDMTMNYTTKAKAKAIYPDIVYSITSQQNVLCYFGINAT